jgi:KaiC/GvpD/RAD55 family RecA-like ATPase
MTSPLSLPVAHQRLLGPAFDTMGAGLALVGAPPAVGKTCVSLNLAVHFAAHLGESVLYFSPGSPKEVVLARLAKNMTDEGQTVDVECVNDLGLAVLDAPTPTSAEMLEAATAFVEKNGQPAIVLVNDLQSMRCAKEDLTGVQAAIEIMADLRAIAKICDAPVVLFSQLAEGKTIARAVAHQADRVVIASLKGETATHKAIEIHYMDPPEPEGERYELSLTRSTGVMGLNA